MPRKKKKFVITSPFVVCTHKKKKKASRVGKSNGFLPSSSSTEALTYSAGDVFIIYRLSLANVLH